MYSSNRLHQLKCNGGSSSSSHWYDLFYQFVNMPAGGIAAYGSIKHLEASTSCWQDSSNGWEDTRLLPGSSAAAPGCKARRPTLLCCLFVELFADGTFVSFVSFASSFAARMGPHRLALMMVVKWVDICNTHKRQAHSQCYSKSWYTWKWLHSPISGLEIEFWLSFPVIKFVFVRNLSVRQY